jgi:hypothetical protein
MNIDERVSAANTRVSAANTRVSSTNARLSSANANANANALVNTIANIITKLSVSSANTRVSEANTRVSEANTSVSEANTSVSEANTSVSETNTSLNELKLIVNELSSVSSHTNIIHNDIIQIDDIEDEINGYINKINSDIGFYWKKRYIYSAFWSNISTPINLSIVILTALTTGENATKDLIGQRVSTILGIVVLFVSIINTFFRPNEQLAKNQTLQEKWADIGEEFDEIYYDRVYTLKEKSDQLVKLEKLFKSMSSVKRMDDNNYLIDLLFFIIRCTCIRGNIDWVHISDTHEIKRKARRSFDMDINSSSV